MNITTKASKPPPQAKQNNHNKQAASVFDGLLPTPTPELSIGVKSAVTLQHLQQYNSSPAPEVFGIPIFQPPLRRGHGVKGNAVRK